MLTYNVKDHISKGCRQGLQGGGLGKALPTVEEGMELLLKMVFFQ